MIPPPLTKWFKQFVCLHDMRIKRKPLPNSDVYILVDACQKCDYEISHSVHPPPYTFITTA